MSDKRMPITVPALVAKKQRGEKIVVLTAYDATMARLLDDSADILLVGDSLGMVVQGGPNTLAVTMDHMVYHCRAVARGASFAHLVGDLPFLSYQTSLENAVANGGRLLQEGSCHAVKLEGGAAFAEHAYAMTRAGIPVMGHIGLLPQSVHQMGGFKVQGREPGGAERLLNDAQSLVEAGVYALILEGIPADIAAQITAAVSVPTIGIGAGPSCDGQVLVINDLLGMDERFRPKFVRRYDDLATRIRTAAAAYANDVRAGTFPNDAESFTGGPMYSGGKP